MKRHSSFPRRTRRQFGLEDRTHTLSPTGLRPNEPQYVVIHGTHSYQEFDDVYQLHRNKGWNGLGYHLFFSNSGVLSQGRPFDKEGAHALGFNTNSVGMGFYQKGERHVTNIKKGQDVVGALKDRYPGIQVIPHVSAQVTYLNQLLHEMGRPERFPEEISLVEPDMFERVRRDLLEFARALNAEQYETLKPVLKDFKNCPGTLVYHFL